MPGFKYASASNSDNLGAVPSPRIAGWFAASGAPYAAELCPRTLADKKGGHLAIRKSDGRLILRDTAQTAPDEMDFFTDEFRHPFFHTNNLWFDLEKLHEALTERGAVLGLPLIRNVKTVDPTDPSSPEVFQIETAMGAAIEVFDGATAIVVGRDRFLPVKTTNDLLVLRSDAYALADDGALRLAVDSAPLVDLDSKALQDDARLRRAVPLWSTLPEQGDVPHRARRLDLWGRRCGHRGRVARRLQGVPETGARRVRAGRVAGTGGRVRRAPREAIEFSPTDSVRCTQNSWGQKTRREVHITRSTRRACPEINAGCLALPSAADVFSEHRAVGKAKAPRRRSPGGLAMTEEFSPQPV